MHKMTCNINKDKLLKLKELLDQMTKENFMAGANLLLLQDGREVCYFETGYRDLENRIPITRDTIFRLFSMSKPITAAAAMILMQEGKIDLLDEVSKYLPGFENQYVLVNGRKEAVRKTNRIQNLLNMTSGIVYGGNYSQAHIQTDQLLEEVTQRMFLDNPLTTVEIMNRLGQLPLAYQPWEGWEYGMSADVLGAVVEVVSGMSYGEFLKKKIFEPLQMNDTGFYVPADKQNRLAKTYTDTSRGLVWNKEENLGIQNEMKIQPAFESGGAGLVSTIDDYAKFTQMLLNGGILGNTRILDAQTVKFMTQSHLSDVQQRYIDQWDSLSGHSYANFMRVVTDPGKASMMCSRGEYGWDGWLGTYMMNDPAHGLSMVLMMQRTDSGTTGYTRRLKNLLFAAMEE